MQMNCNLVLFQTCDSVRHFTLALASQGSNAQSRVSGRTPIAAIAQDIKKLKLFPKGNFSYGKELQLEKV